VLRSCQREQRQRSMQQQVQDCMQQQVQDMPPSYKWMRP
jgi:hypothetical protein